MDILVGIAAVVVMISVPTVLGLIYVELRQVRLFGRRGTFGASTSGNDTAAIAMSLQSEIERLRSDVHSAMTGLSTDLEQVRDHLSSHGAVSLTQIPATTVHDSAPRLDAERASALSALYSALSRLDVAFLAVARPVLLPGETFDPDTDLPTEALRWESWGAVGTAAYQFAEVFSERRICLDVTTRDRLNTYLGSIRKSLTARLYPALNDRDGSVAEGNRVVVNQVIAELAADIVDIRTILEHATLPSHIHNHQ